MKWLSWFDTSASDAFAREIAAEFARTLPSATARTAARDAEQRARQAVEVIANRARKFNAAQPLGWYRKSSFMRTVEDCLRQEGHSAELIEQVVYALALRMAR